MVATRESLLGIKRRYRLVDIGDGQQVRIQSLSEGERTLHEMRTSGKDGSFDKRAAEKSRRSMLVLSVVDDDGKRLFGDDELDAIAGIDGLAVGLIYAECLDLNYRINRKEVEAAIKNSDTTAGESQAE